MRDLEERAKISMRSAGVEFDKEVTKRTGMLTPLIVNRFRFTALTIFFRSVRCRELMKQECEADKNE